MARKGLAGRPESSIEAFSRASGRLTLALAILTCRSNITGASKSTWTVAWRRFLVSMTSFALAQGLRQVMVFNTAEIPEIQRTYLRA